MSVKEKKKNKSKKPQDPSLLDEENPHDLTRLFYATGGHPEKVQAAIDAGKKVMDGKMIEAPVDIPTITTPGESDAYAALLGPQGKKAVVATPEIIEEEEKESRSESSRSSSPSLSLQETQKSDSEDEEDDSKDLSEALEKLEDVKSRWGMEALFGGNHDEIVASLRTLVINMRDSKPSDIVHLFERCAVAARSSREQYVTTQFESSVLEMKIHMSGLKDEMDAMSKLIAAHSKALQEKQKNEKEADEVLRRQAVLGTIKVNGQPLPDIASRYAYVLSKEEFNTLFPAGPMTLDEVRVIAAHKKNSGR